MGKLVGIRTAAAVAALGFLAALSGGGTGIARAQSQAETSFWNRVKDSRNPQEVRAYLEAYPNGTYAGAARERLKQLQPAAIDQPRSGPSPSASALADAATITEVQQRLYNLNYNLDINGRLTEDTRKAIGQWQRNIGRPVTGDMNLEELTLIRRAILPTTWGALGYAARGAGAAVWNHPSRQSAERAALEACRKQRGGGSNCKVVTGGGSFCGALAFCEGRVARTIYFGGFASVLATLGQATDHALSECRRQAKRPDTCGIKLTFCADGSHKK